MFQTLKNAWKLTDLRNKLIFTAIIIMLYRVGTAIPVPFLNAAALDSAAQALNGSIFQYLNILSGNAFAQATLFALGINPYITSSIVMQLLTIAIPALERLSKDGGEEGKKKINQITRCVTIALAIITAIGYYFLMKGYGLWTDTSVLAAITIISCYCAGSALVMWLAEKINESGIGNGISIILFANIISRGPAMLGNMWSMLTSGKVSSIIIAIVSAIIGLAMLVFIVFMTNSERRIPIQYAKKVVGRKMYGGQSSTLPLKLNMTGVMPIIFANSIVTLPSTIFAFITVKDGSFGAWLKNFLSSDSWFYALATFGLIIAFAYFYVAISFNPVEVANNLKKNGGFIPGIRPGKPTSDYITKILNRITLIGALFLGVIAVLPLIANMITGGSLSELAFGGSSIIIVVGVVLETTREIEAQMTMRHYKGFLE